MRCWARWAPASATCPATSSSPRWVWLHLSTCRTLRGVALFHQVQGRRGAPAGSRQAALLGTPISGACRTSTIFLILINDLAG